MSRNTFAPFVTFSAELAGIDHSLNAARHGLMVGKLAQAGLSFAPEIQGAYKGVAERSILVLIPEGDDSEAFMTILRLAKAFSQESILYVDGERHASLVFCDSGHWQSLGLWHEVSEAEALARDGYSKLGNTYYAVG